jgi:hypothetical protein
MPPSRAASSRGSPWRDGPRSSFSTPLASAFRTRPVRAAECPTSRCRKSRRRGASGSRPPISFSVEIVSPGSETLDELVKPREYARAGIPRYWLVERDAAQTVTLHVLGPGNAYEVIARRPLARLLRSAPADHLGD